MYQERQRLELLAPAKNADFGIEAINHGADAVYIGGPAFGARSNAGNSIADIERLAAHAHRYNGRVLVALNTILYDHEVEDARRLAWQMYEAGADALILQDMGMLELDLPPIQLHASTQTDIRTPEKAKFLEDVGFSQIVLARELNLGQIRQIAKATTCQLEFFIHGALCVAFSGQCFISHAHTGRSANRGECSQACRLPYDLEDGTGQTLAEGKHLLSMKDNDQSANLEALVQAGISSFKIEGRLKDLSYVKNITAHYRQELDRIIADRPEYSRISLGHSTYTFEPQPEKTFNRGTTDYFVNARQPDIGAFDTPKFSGEVIGDVVRVSDRYFEADTRLPLNNGDGLSFFDDHEELCGLRINKVEGNRIYPTTLPTELKAGMVLYRNRDQEFERALEKKSAERRVRVDLHFAETAEGYQLTLTDEAGVSASAQLPHAKEAARDADKALAGLREHLAKLGSTMFEAGAVTIDTASVPFLPASAVNGLRRQAVDALEAARAAAYQRPPRAPAVEPPPVYPDEELDYTGNVLNQKARDFYARHGVKLIADAYEADQEKGAVSLMITKHCIRFSYNLCPKEVEGIKADPMTLVRGNERLTLKFDCKRCEMHVIGKMKKNRTIMVKAASTAACG